MENTSGQILFVMYSIYMQPHLSHLLNLRNVILKSLLAEIHLKDVRLERGLKALVMVTQQQQKIVSIPLRRVNNLNKMEDRRSLIARLEK